MSEGDAEILPLPEERKENEWRDLPPIPEEERAGVEIGYVSGDQQRISQTFLRSHDRCERAAFLYAKYEGGAGSHPMERGSIFHEVAARGVRHLVAEEENELPPEVGKDLLIAVMKEEFTKIVPSGERDSLRAMVFNFCAGTRIEPANVIAVEETFSLRVGRWTVRGRIDLAELVGNRIEVTDYKTSFNMPTQEEFEGDFQTMLYALALAFGELGTTGLRIGGGVEEFLLRQRFPRYLKDNDGHAEIAERSFSVTKAHLTDFLLDLEMQLDRLDSNIESGKWQAVPGSHCSECTSPAECPLPRHLRPESQMAISTLSDAERMAQWLIVEGDRTRRAKARLKKWASENGHESILAGTDLEFRFEYREGTEIIDRDEMFLAVEGAVQYGHPFDREQHVRKKKETRFEKRKVKPQPKPAPELCGAVDPEDATTWPCGYVEQHEGPHEWESGL